MNSLERSKTYRWVVLWFGTALILACQGLKLEKSITAQKLQSVIFIKLQNSSDLGTDEILNAEWSIWIFLVFIDVVKGIKIYKQDKWNF